MQLLRPSRHQENMSSENHTDKVGSIQMVQSKRDKMQILMRTGCDRRKRKMNTLGSRRERQKCALKEEGKEKRDND